MNGGRRFSQAIAEGDGISVIARVQDLDGARVAEAEGAEGIAVARPLDGLRDATPLPVLLDVHAPADEARGAADAVLLSIGEVGDDAERLDHLQARARELDLELVVAVADENELELALERLDPEIFLLLAPEAGDGEEAVDHVLELLPDVPAGKLAIAAVISATRDQVVALERAGVDAVVVAGQVAELVPQTPPDV